MSNSLAPANRSRLPALVLAIAMAPSFVCAINIPPEIPCEVTMQPSWRILGSRQVPNPAQIGKPVEVIWQVEATGGLYRPSYTSGDPPPADVLISQWGIDGYGALSGGGGVITISDEFTARNGQVRYWGLKRAYYIDPCGTGGKKFGDGSLPMMYHTISLEPAPPNEPPIHDEDIDDFRPLPVNPPPPPPDPPSPDDSPRPDQGEAEFVQEVADPASYFMDPSRGWLPKRSDKYVIIKKDLNDPLYEGANDEYVELIYRLITINSPEPRTLHGTLMIDVKEGNPSDYQIIHRNKETGHEQVISLPYQMPVTEPGHEGGGIHDWHNGFESFSFRRIGDGGLRLKFTVDPTEGDPFKTASLHLLPVEVAVDADRDGEITFDGKDKTTAEKPFRFWINNDQDDVEADEPILVENPDSFDNEIIQTKRDLEDFCRLKLQVGLSNQTLRDGDFQIGLMFKGGSGATPGIRIWKNQSNDGNLDYLKDHNAATAQIALGAFVKFPPLQVTLIPKDYWASRSDSTAHLIFEGTSKGKGELVVTIHDKHGAKLGEGSGIWMELLDVREMYQRARVANEAEQIPSPATNPTPPAQTWVWDPWDWTYSEDPQATEKTAIFVHGWRLKYMDYMNWSDTSYKRLWHQGFKGKFYSFRWATFSGDNNGLPYGYDENIEGTAFPPGGTTYNASEYRAWLCGPTLASFVNQLPNAGNRSLFAHSMGNVISGAALRSGMSIQRYAMCNAAMAAMAYDPDPILRNVDNIFLPGTIPELRDTPDTNPDPAIRTNYGLENKFNLPGNPTVFNFGLPDDSALGSWSANNLFFKPNTQYLYTENSILQPFPLVYQATPVSSFRSVTAVPEAMGYVTKSRTRSAGADLRTNGKIAAGNKIDMKNWFADTHSAQWRWSNHSTELFWKELSIRLILKEENP